MSLHSLTIRNLTPALLGRLRALARSHRRSLNSEVLELLERGGAAPEPADPRSAPSPMPGLGPQRLAQLEADLRLTPEQRVLEVEDMVDSMESARNRPRVHQVVLFDSLEDHLAWQQRNLLW